MDNLGDVNIIVHTCSVDCDSLFKLVSLRFEVYDVAVFDGFLGLRNLGFCGRCP